MTERGKKGLETSKEVFKMASKHYMDAHEAKKQGKPVTWMTGYDPVELIYAMDVAVVYPENYSALCAVTQVAPKFIEASERLGYSPDLCSYARNTIGTTYMRRKPHWVVLLLQIFLLLLESSVRPISSGGRF